MNFENIKSDGMHYEYKVVFSAAEIEDEILKAVQKKAKTFKMQGFRAGHVPLNIVRNSVENTVMKDVFDDLISKACNEIIKDSNAKDLASRPTYKFENSYEKGNDVNLTLTFEIAPSFEIQSYEIAIEKIMPKVSDEEVSEARNQLMISSPIYEKADREYVVKAKDEVSYKATCYNSGVESKKKSFANTVLIPDVIPEGAEFLGNFVGKKIGESFDFIPATDKNLTYKVMIKSIKKALTDISAEDFAEKRGFKNVEELDSAIREKLENDIHSQAFLYHKNQILEALEKQYNFELPKGIIDQEMNAVIANVKKELETEAKQAEKEGKKVETKTDDELKKEYSEVVNKRVLLGYVLNKIAKEEKIGATEREVQNVIMAEINRNPNMANAMIQYYTNNSDAVAYKKAEIIEHKVVSFLISKAKSTEIEKTKKETDAIVEKLLEE